MKKPDSREAGASFPSVSWPTEAAHRLQANRPAGLSACWTADVQDAASCSSSCTSSGFLRENRTPSMENPFYITCARNENSRKIPCSHGKGQTSVWTDEDSAEDRAGQTAVALPCLLNKDFVVNSKVKLGGVFRSWNP